MVDELGKPVVKARVVMAHLCIPDATTETDAMGHFRIDSLLPEQGVDLWVNGKTLKAKAGTENLVVGVPGPPTMQGDGKGMPTHGSI